MTWIPSTGAGEGSAALAGKDADETLAGDRSDGEKRPSADGFHEVSGTEKMESEDLADSTLEVFEDAPETLAPVDGDDQAETLAPQKTEDADLKAGSSILAASGGNSMVEGEGPPNLATCMDAKPSPMVADNGKEAALAADRDQENAGFSATDMVWGKIKSHPWWPGQIFDRKYASDLALKHQKKDQNFLVAYFGDKTFAWCEESQLKPFRPCFAHMERQTNVEAFVYAVEDALEEVSRRVELGMLCHCVADETFSHLENKEVENAGIQEGMCGAVVDRGSMVDSFVPEKLLEYVKSLACCPLEEVERLELVTATAQIKAFYRSKGVTELAIFADGERLVDNDAEVTSLKSKKSAKGKANKSVLGASDVLSGKKRPRGRPRKLQEFLQDGMAVADESTVSSGKKSGGRPRKIQDATEDGKAIGDGSARIYGEKRQIVKPRKLQDAAEDEEDVSNGSTLLSGKKRGRGRPRKVQNMSEDGDIGHAANGKGGVSGTKSTSRASGKQKWDDDLDYEEERRGRKKRPDYSDKESPSSARRAVKIGERIRRVASQVQEGSPSIFKTSIEELQSSVAKGISGTEYPSPEEMLSQLCLVARDPMRGYSFVPTIVSFFTDFNSLNSSKEQKPLKAAGGKRGRKKKVDSEPASSDLPTVDPYWSDRRLLLDSSPETEPVSRVRKRKNASKVKKQNKKLKSAGESLFDPPLDPMMEDEQGLPTTTLSPSPSDKQELAEGGRSGAVEKTEEAGEGPRNGSMEKVDKFSPTALILSFTEADALPSAADLIKIFSPYGPLKEDETEVMKKTNRAKVVFKRRNDAEIAFSSAGKYSVFGPALVSYRLRYLQSSPKAAQGTPEDKKDATLQSLPKASQATSSEDKLDASRATSPEEKLDASQAISPENKKDATLQLLPTVSHVTSDDKKDVSLASSEDKKDVSLASSEDKKDVSQAPSPEEKKDVSAPSPEEKKDVSQAPSPEEKKDVSQAPSPEEKKDATSQSLPTASQTTSPEDKKDASQATPPADMKDATSQSWPIASQSTSPEDKLDVSQATSEDKKDATLQSLHTAYQATSPEDKKGAYQAVSPEDKNDVTLQSLPTASQAISEDKKDAMPTEVGNMELQAQETNVVANDNT